MSNYFVTDIFHAAAGSDVGCKRTNNEDKWLVSLPKNRKAKRYKGYLFVVADGMGGRAAGEIASSLAVNEVEEYYYNSPETDHLQVLEKALVSAHRQITANGLQHREYSGMGTTVTAVAAVGNRLYLAHVGDSRAYLFRNKLLHQLTHDHTLTSWLAANGKITLEEARNHPQRHILTQAVGGAAKEPSPELEERQWEDDDILLLCSDGLYSLVSDQEIRDVLLSDQDLQKCVSDLINLANDRGGTDNITVVLIQKKRHYMSRFIKRLTGRVQAGLSAVHY